MPKVLYRKTGRIGRITLNRPEVLNAIDHEVPCLIAEAVAEANADPGVHVIVLAGSGPAFCTGYGLTYYSGPKGRGQATQPMSWDPRQDYAFMSRNTERFMAIWRSPSGWRRCRSTSSPSRRW